MKEDINLELNNCFDEFQNMLLSDNYINLKTYNNFLDKYKDTLEMITKDYLKLDELTIRKGKSILNNGYKIINKRNKKFVDKKLEDNKNYFDNMFITIDKNIKLDDEQRKAIIMDEDYSLIVAGAGSGKTTTMSAKVKYLVEKCNVNPNDIIILSYTNKATEELEKRINKDFNLNIEILTFHKLGMKILRKRTDKPLQIIDNIQIYSYISDYIKDTLFKDKEKLKTFVESFDEYVNFNECAFEYDNFNDYYNEYKQIIYEENKDNLEDYIVKRIQNRLKNLKGIDGIIYKSKPEVIIANYLFKNGFEYEYEKTFPFKLENDASYKPDFTILNNEVNTYVEYYGLTELKNNNKYTVSDIQTYNNLVKKKKELHEKFETDLIELYSDYENHNNYLEVLEQELEKRYFVNIPKENKEIFDKIMDTSTDINFYKFVELAIKFIKKFKEFNYELSYFDELIENQQDDKLKQQLIFMKEIYIYYNKTIHNNYLIDFNDMINYSYNEIDSIKDSFNFKYIIIDEYQDISIPKYRLIKKLSDLYDSKIVAVGDDWQAIYSFSGSDIDLFKNFSELMGYGEISKITKTYRNSQELIDVAGNFISKNVDQFNKDLISNKHLKNPVEIDYYFKNKGISKAYVLNSIIKSISHNGTILLLGRYKSDINSIIDSPYFKKGPHNKIICKECKNANVEFMTIHKSKGLGYDNVIILNGLSSKKGFPSSIEDDELIKLLDNSKEEKIGFAEERRLFYVALTRTKNKVYILAPYIPKYKRSDFIFEISNMDNVKENMKYVEKYKK